MMAVVSISLFFFIFIVLGPLGVTSAEKLMYLF